MVVRCVTSFVLSDNPNVVNKDLREYLKEGADYFVYGIRVAEESSYFMLFDDGHLIEAPSKMFKIIDGEVSPLWIVKNDETNGMTFWPKLFYEDNFFENFSEWEEKERNAFEVLSKSFVVYKKALQ